jgi:CTP:molybdopterin cytidylyltransferase MocA/SAM-dependent methyltransferase
VERPSPTVRAIVLAAGAGSRFGGGKLEARVDGKPIIQHVLDALADSGLDDPIVVLAAPVTAAIEWRRAEQVINPDPSRGLSSSVRLGWAEALEGRPTSEAPPPEALLLVLGDQPLVRPEAIEALAAEPLDPARPIVAPAYENGDAHNPVRVDATAGDLVAARGGDRGLGPLLDDRPDLVRWLDVPGGNPDVDTRDDLASVAEQAWADRVRRNREQVEAFREVHDGPDFYRSVSAIFLDDPDRTSDPVLAALLRHARREDSWLDIGAGAGRYALPLARAVRQVIALDPSPSMLGALRAAMDEHAIDNVISVDGRWPEAFDTALGPMAFAGLLPVDVSLIAHVGYDVEAIGPFVDAMERATRGRCLAVLMERSPALIAEPFWPPLHGEARVALPALPAFVDLLAARGRAPEVEMVESSRRHWASRDELVAYVRLQTWVREGSRKDREMLRLLDSWLVTNRDGTVDLSVADPLRVGVVGWSPAGGVG